MEVQFQSKFPPTRTAEIGTTFPSDEVKGNVVPLIGKIRSLRLLWSGDHTLPLSSKVSLMS